MKVLLLLLSAAMFCIAMSQEEIDTRPQAFIVVREHPTTADIVEISMLDPNYPPELLKTQAEKIGLNAGSPARGLMVSRQKTDPENPKLDILKAKFATDNLIDRATGILRLQPIIRAFAGAPTPHEIRVLNIVFEGEAPSQNVIQKLSNDGVKIRGASHSGDFGGLEFRVALLTQDPEKIIVPEKQSPEKPPVQKTSETGPSVLMLVLIGVAALAAGGLVYFLVVQGSRRQPTDSSRRIP